MLYVIAEENLCHLRWTSHSNASKSARKIYALVLRISANTVLLTKKFVLK